MAIPVMLLLASAWVAAGQSPSPAARLEKLKAEGVNAELTVFPVAFGGRALAPAGEVLAMSLENGGMRNIEWSDRVFSPPAAASFEQVSAAFAEFVRGSAIKGYGLYAEVLGERGVGITEVRGILVDKAGEPVWIYRQTARDEEFKKVQPHEPLECIFMLVNALREPLGLRDPFGPNRYEGRLTQAWAKRTGLPTSGERAAMQQAVENARAKLPASKVVVFPVFAAGQPDPEQAARLAEKLTREKVAQAEAAAARPDIPIENVPNEQQRLWKMARAFRDYLRQAPPQADYAIFADYAFAPDGRPFTVHFVLCDRAGEWVIVDFQNEHHPDFRSVQPRSREDCDRLVVQRLAGYLKR